MLLMLMLARPVKFIVIYINFIYVYYFQFRSVIFVFEVRDFNDIRPLEHLSFGPLRLDLFF